MTSRNIIIPGFVLMLVLLLVMTLISLRQMAINHKRMDVVVSQYSVKIDLFNSLRHIARERSMFIFHMLSLRDPFMVEEMREDMSQLASEFIKIREQLISMELTAREAENLAMTLEQVKIVSRLHAEIMDLMGQGNFAAANDKMLNANLPEQDKLLALYNEVLAIQRQATEQALADASNTYQEARTTTIALGAIMIVIGLTVSIFVVRNTARIEDDLNVLNTKLEERVKHRTETLEVTNSVLQKTIDELNTTQSQLVQSEKMASLGNLVAGMAHEINTPLGVSVTSASSMQVETQTLRHALDAGTMKKSDLLNFMEHTEQGCAILLANLKRAATLISSFKLVAVDQSTDDWRLVKLHTYIDEILVSLRPHLKKTNVFVSNECDPDLIFYTNPGALYQIFSNLIVNSLTHAFEPDWQGHIRIQSRQEGTGIALEYYDDGKGIAPENIKRVFDPFFTTRRGSGGSGLGLHIVYNLVTSTLRGSIDVQSRMGAGVAFIIKLPLVSEEPKNE